MYRVPCVRVTSTNGTTIDLHGTTITEAVYIVKNTMQEEVPTNGVYSSRIAQRYYVLMLARPTAKPLKIITSMRQIL